MAIKIRYKNVAYVVGIFLIFFVYFNRKSFHANGGRPQVLIVSYYRSGTTFVADLLHLHPDTFLHFEPLFLLTAYDTVETQTEVEEAIFLLEHLLRCEFETLAESAPNKRTVWLYHYYAKNDFDWPRDMYNRSLAFQTRTLSRACRSRSIPLLKIVRLRLRHAERLLETFPDLKVVYLTRDPRAMFSSRKERGWCRDTPSCIQPGVFCQHMTEDLKSAGELEIKFPDRFTWINYENLVLDLSAQTERLFEFLNLDYELNKKSVEGFIESHTGLTVEGTDDPYSTFRKDSKKRAYSWNTTLPANDTSYVENACKNVILLLKKSFNGE